MTQEINLAPVIEKLRKGVCRRITEGRPAVVVDIEETEHFMRSVADILAALRPAPVASGGQHSSGEVDEEHGGKRDTWSDFESDHLTDGKGYATAETYRRCREAFDANWLKGRKAAYDAALSALKSTAAQEGGEL